MNYEDLYTQLQGAEKKLKDNIAAASKQQKAIAKDTDRGDLKDLAKCIQSLNEAITAQQETVRSLQEALDQFDTAAYFQSGDFTRQMLEACEKEGVDVTGEFPVYEMFPYRVRIDAENQDIYMNRKKVACMRPESFVETVRESQEKLKKSKSNMDAFAAELEQAYDTTVMKLKKKPGSDIYLTSIYRMMVPMARSRKEYDMQSFAYDLARLYSGDTVALKDGRRYQFGSSRNVSKCIRILDENGKEQFLATIQFV